MNKVDAVVLIAALMAAPASVRAGTATSACTAGMHLGQRSEMPAAVLTVDERVDEYLEFHARAAEANGRRQFSAWPDAPSKTN
jgi:hypothetical protein